MILRTRHTGEIDPTISRLMHHLICGPPVQVLFLFTCRLRTRVPTRASSKKKEARGIYQHAEVIPGRDWITTTTNQGEQHLYPNQ